MQSKPAQSSDQGHEEDPRALSGAIFEPSWFAVLRFFLSVLCGGESDHMPLPWLGLIDTLLDVANLALSKKSRRSENDAESSAIAARSGGQLQVAGAGAGRGRDRLVRLPRRRPRRGRRGSLDSEASALNIARIDARDRQSTGSRQVPFVVQIRSSSEPAGANLSFGLLSLCHV